MPKQADLITSKAVFEEQEQFPLSVKRLVDHAASHHPHRHEFHELVILYGGSGLHVTDNGSYPIESGDVFMIRGDMSHAYAETQEVDLINILFRPGPLAMPLHHLRDLPGYHALFRIEPKLRESGEYGQRLRLSEDQLAEAMKYVTSIELELATRDPGYRFSACAQLMNLLGHLARCYDDSNRPEQRSMMQLGAVLSFMERNLDKEITVPQLALIANMSESTLTRRFKKVLGRTPVEHLLRLRIGRSRRLMQNPDMNITDISLACGFTDSNYFSRRFKADVGQSPTVYRRSL